MVKVSGQTKKGKTTMKYTALLNKLNGKYNYTLEEHNILVISRGTKEVGVVYTNKVLTLLAPQKKRNARTLYEGKLNNKLAAKLIANYLK